MSRKEPGRQPTEEKVPKNNSDEESISITSQSSDDDDSFFLFAEKDLDVTGVDSPPLTLLQRHVTRDISIPGAHPIAGPGAECEISRDCHSPATSSCCDVENQQQVLPSCSMGDGTEPILTATLVVETEESTLAESMSLPTLTASTPVLARAELADEPPPGGDVPSKKSPLPKQLSVQQKRTKRLLCCVIITALLVISGLVVGLALALKKHGDSSSSSRASKRTRKKFFGNSDKRKSSYYSKSSKHGKRTEGEFSGRDDEGWRNNGGRNDGRFGGKIGDKQMETNSEGSENGGGF